MDISQLRQLAERVEHGAIKALSIRQPWCHHIFHDSKDVENRSWATRGRGWIMIHAALSQSDIDKETEGHLPRGGIVGLTRIVDCVTEIDSQWFTGPYGFVLRNAFPIDIVHCKGALGFFQVPSDVAQSVAASIRELEQ